MIGGNHRYEQQHQQITQHRGADHRGRQVTFAGRSHQTDFGLSASSVTAPLPGRPGPARPAAGPPVAARRPTVSSASGSTASQGIITNARRWASGCGNVRSLSHGDHLGPRVVTGDQIHVEGARAPALTANPTRGPLELLGRAQPAVPVAGRVVGDQHRVEERSLLDLAPRVGLVDRRHRHHCVAEPVDDRLQPGQPVAQVGADRKHDPGHSALPSGSRRAPRNRDRRAAIAGPRPPHRRISAGSEPAACAPRPRRRAPVGPPSRARRSRRRPFRSGCAGVQPRCRPPSLAKAS